MVSDAKDREKIREKLKDCIDPLNAASHRDSIVNVVTSKMCQDSVNVDDAVRIGRNQMVSYEESWPEGFHASLPKCLMTIADTKKHVKLGSEAVFDPDLIHSRVMCLMITREIDLQELFEHELFPVPTAMLDDDGEMSIVKLKSVLKINFRLKSQLDKYT